MTKSTTQKSPTRNLFTWLTAGMLVAFCSFNSMAQNVSVTGGTAATAGSPYATFAAALAAVNANPATGAIVINFNIAGYSETAPATGFVIGSGTLNPTLSSTNTLSITKTSGVVTLNAGIGTSTPGSAVQDGILNIVGADYVSINGITFTDGNAANPATMEYGIGLFKASATDGAQNNTIQSCIITLNRINNAGGTGPAVDGSRGINVVNSLVTTQTTAVTVTAASGANSNNKFYTNTIQNCNIGISLIGFADVTPFTNADIGNDVGGTSAGQGNQILNYGGGAATSAAAAVRTLAQYGLNISYNTIDNNNGAGVNHATTLRGIYTNTATSASETISFNSITVRCGATSSQLAAIENVAGSTAASNTIAINNNIITCQYPTATSGVLYGVYNNGATPTTLNINNNTFSISTAATSGSLYPIFQSGSVVTTCNTNNNNISSVSCTAASTSLTFRGIYLSSAATTLNWTASTNNIQSVVFAGTHTGAFHFLYNSNTITSESINFNTITNLTIPSSSTVQLIYVSNNTNNVNINDNSIVTAFNNNNASTSGSSFMFIYNFGSPTALTQSIFNNNFSNVTINRSASTIASSTGNYGIFWATNVNVLIVTQNVYSNTVSNWNNTGAGLVQAISVQYGDANNVYSNTISSITSLGGVIGLQVANGSTVNMNVYSNNISGLTTTGSSTTADGLVIGSAVGTGATTTLNIYRNTICSIAANGVSGVSTGLNFLGAASTNVSNISNNRIGGITAPNSTSATAVAGIYVSNTTANSIKLYYNSVYLSGTSAGSGFGSSAIRFNTAPNCDARNNMFVNATTPTGAGLAVAHRRTSTTLSTYNAASNNNIWFGTTYYFDGTNTDATFGAYQTRVSTRDNASASENPASFVSTTCGNANFLKITGTTPSAAESGGQNIAGFIDDYATNGVRSPGGYPQGGQVNGGGTAPDIGAYEYDGTKLAICAGTPSASTINGAAAVCQNTGTTLSLSTVYTDLGISYQWQSSTVSGGPYTNMGTGATQATGNLTVPMYYIAKITCSFSGLTYTTAEKSVLINAPPTVTITPTPGSAAICGAGSVSLAASGASTYTWNPTTNLSPTTGTPVTASPTVTTIYTVTGTDVNGCTGTASQTVTVSPGPTTPTVTPNSPNTICLGASQPLTASSTSTAATILSEGFESGAPGWSFIDSSSTGTTLPQQVWHIQPAPYTDPSGSIFFTNFSVTGSNFAYTNADAGGSGSQTRTFMVSPSFSTVGYTGAGTLGFKMCYKFWGSSSPAEQVMVQISIDGGTTWAATLANYSPTNTGPDVGTTTNNAEVAVPVTVNIPGIYMGQPNVKIRFRYLSNWGYVWIVDDVALTATPIINYAWTSTAGSGLPGGAGTPSPANSSISATPTVAGAYTYTVTASVGSCTASSTTATVTVNEAPVIGACPLPITQCDNHVATWTDPTATGTPTPTVVCSPLSGSTFATGTTLVTCTATNSCSPPSSCSFNVTINETPVIAACPSDITQCDNHVATWTDPTATGTPTPTVVCSPASGSTFATGTTLVTCTATNSCGTDDCSFNVTINETPVIAACPSDITQCDNHVATWTDPTATGTPSPTVVCVPASGSTFATGTTLVTCTATNSCGTDDCSFNVTINETPVIAACPSDITQCDNHVATWTDPTATGTPAATVVCVPASGSTFATGTTLVTCTATNSCGTDDCSFNVTINESATAPTSVTTDDGDNEICTSGTITLTANGGTLGSPAGTYTWYEGGCGTGSIIGTGTTLVRGPGLSVGTHVYYVRINQAACGNTTCASVSVVVTGAPPATNVPFPTVPAYACSGNNLPASTSPVTYATTYTWDGPVGTTFNSVSNPYASGSTSVTVNYGAPNGSGYNICVQGSNACGTTTRRCSFVRGTVNVPGTITAANNRTIECPSTSAGYSIAAVGGATSYTWSITGNATVVGSGTSATVNFGAGWTSGTLSVTANTPCYSSAPRSLALSNVTALPGAISGPASVCPGGPAQVYSVPAVAGASTYNWVLPANATGSSSSNSISVTFLTGYTFGDIKVSITSICGNTSAQQAKTVTTGIPNQPASVSGNASGLCNQTTVYSCPSVTGASSYTWSVSGGSINSGQGSTSINVTFGAFVNGNVCVTANNGCGSSAPRCLPVIAKPAISGNITYTPGTICANQSGVDFQINPVYGTSGYNWIFPSGVSVVLDLGNEQIVNWGTNSGVVSVTAANACGSATKTTTITLTCREAATETIEANSSISVYPNPAHDRINVQFNATEKTNYVLNLMDLSGRVMSTANATAQKGMNTSELDLSTLAKGVYMIEVKSDLINKQIRVVVE